MRILIVKLSSIGDVIHTLPALAELRRHFPSCEISWVVERSSAQLLRDNPLLDDLIEIDTRAWRRNWSDAGTPREVAHAIGRLRTRPFDVGFDFQGLIKSGLMLQLSGARRRIGFDTTGLREKPSLVFLTEQVPVSYDGHVIEKNLQLLRALGIERTGPYEFPMNFSEEDRRSVDSKLTTMAIGPFGIVNPGASWKGKQWSPDGYAAVCDHLWSAHGLHSLVTHGPAEEELAREVAGRAGASAIPFPCPLKQLALLSDRASLFVSGDTGPLHLAAARGTPIVAIFGCTLARRNGPFSPQDEVVQDPHAVPRTYYDRSRDDKYLNVSVDEVQQAIRRRLARASTTGAHRRAPEAASASD